MASDPTLPAEGSGPYYMTRGRNVCGDGIWGRNSADEDRPSAACP